MEKTFIPNINGQKNN